MNNLKQLAIVKMFYADDNDDRLPPYWRYNETNGLNKNIYLDLRRYTTGAGIWNCPSGMQADAFAECRDVHVGSDVAVIGGIPGTYAYNFQLASGEYYTNPSGPIKSWRISDMDPAGIYFGDAYGAAAFRISKPQAAAGHPAFPGAEVGAWHLGTAVLMHHDGHVEAWNPADLVVIGGVTTLAEQKIIHKYWFSIPKYNAWLP